MTQDLNESGSNQNRIVNTLFCYKKSGQNKSRVGEAGNLRRASNWLRHDAERRESPRWRTRKKRRGRLYKSNGVEEVGRMMNVLSEPSRQRGSVARL